MPTVTGKATEFITFSRGSLGTVTDADGKIKWAPHNLLTHSEQFDNAGWTKSSATVTANSDAAPNGTTTADTIAASGANGTALQTYTALAVPYVFAVWLKRKTGTGTIEIAADNGTYTAVTITASWALYTVTQTPAAGSRSAGIRIVTSGDEVYAWGAHLYRADLGGMQANASAYPTYNPTTSAAYHGPRLDYDPVTLACRGLLIEEQRTNLLLRSAEFNAGDWWLLSGGTGSAPVVTANAGTAPDGTSTADRIVFDRGAGTTSGDVSRIFQDPTNPSSGVGTISVWLRSYDGVSSYSVRLLCGFADGFGAGEINITVTGAWQRFILSSTNTTFNFQFGLFGDKNQQTADVLAWGGQAEYGAFATSYIPTAAASVTRSADVASVATSQFPYLESEGSLVASMSFLSGSIATDQITVQIDDGTTSKRHKISRFSAALYGTTTNTTAQADISLLASAPAGSIFKAAYAFKENDFAGTAGGVAPATDTSGTMPTGLSTMRIGNNVGSVSMNGHVRQITYLPRRLTNAELQARTA